MRHRRCKEVPVRHKVDAEFAGGDRELQPLAGAGDRKREGDDPSELGAHAGRVNLDGPPERDGTGDELACG
jgi:hypothetical protein